MNKDDLIERQSRLGWTNRQLAARLCRSTQTVSNWRCGRQTIPDYVRAFLDEIEKNVSAAQS